MGVLDAGNVRLGARPTSKEEAIRLVGALLVGSGHIEPGYVDSMFAREAVANTFLGAGIAIPHGVPADRGLIRRTGIAVVQVPAGVEWNPGETVRLVVGIAAASDEHLGILANLTRVLAEDAEVERLATTRDPAVIVDRLGGDGAQAPAAEPVPDVELEGFAGVEVLVPGALGLHARPATVLVEVASRFHADVRVRSGGRVANARSLAALLGLGAGAGTPITLLARGPDARAALDALQGAVAAGLGEEPAGAEPAAPVAPAGAAFTPTGAATAVAGVPASPGVAIGPVWHLTRQRLVVAATSADPVGEERSLHRALQRARAELRVLHDEVAGRAGAAEAAIFRAHEAFLDDPELTAAAVAGIADGRSAGAAWQAAVDEQVAGMQGLGDPLLAGRAADVADVGRRVLRFLAVAEEEVPELPAHAVVLLAEDLTPSDTAAIDPARVLGFCTALGGPTSHTAIVARALGIPAVVGAGPAALTPEDGATAVLDGSGGTLWLGLGEEDLAVAGRARRDLEDQRDEERRERFRPAITVDGHRVEVVANAARADEAQAAVDAGAEGIGLLRTEFLFLGRDAPPSEEEQLEALEEMVRALNGLPLIVRTLDIGGDKRAPYLDLPDDDGSMLGMRGIRLCLARPDLFLPQLRAIYRASARGPVAVMFPMIARLEDLRAARALADQARAEVGADPIDVGIMIEVPSAVAMAPELAREVQFFSIGTNDLTQYVLAMDRLHPALARQADALHPAVLRMIRATVEAADGAGIWVGVCGGVAGEPGGALILTGLGVRELSVSVPAVAAVKARLRATTLAATRDLATRALACATADEVRALVLP